MGGALTSFTSRSNGAPTITGFRVSKTVRHNDAMIKMTEGVREKTNCSNPIVKSKSPRQPKTLGPSDRSLVSAQAENNILWLPWPSYKLTVGHWTLNRV